MKSFFSKHSYSMVKMFLNQFATAIFGFVLALAAGKAQNKPLLYATSIAAILFYMFLLYTMTWEIGFKDKVSVDGGRLKKNLWTGTLISLCANSVNFLLAIFILLGQSFHVGLLNDIGGVCASIAVALEGMFSGIMTLYIGGAPINSYWLTYFIIPLPAILVSTLAYILGLKDIKFTPLFDPVIPESDREPKKRK